MVHNIGDHRTRVGSIMNGIGDLMGYGGSDQANIFYSAPLHGDGIERNLMQQARNGLAMSPNLPTTVEEILSKFFEVARLYTAKDSPVLVEYHKDRTAELLQAGVAWGLHRWATIDTHDIVDGKTYLMQLHVFTRGSIKVPQGYIANLNGLQGLARATVAIKPWAKKDGILMDPCCGMGITARAAMSFGMRYRGNDPREEAIAITNEVLHGKAKPQVLPGVQEKAKGRK